MMLNKFWILLAKKSTGEILQEEERELQQLLSLHPEYHVVLEALEGMEGVDRLSVSDASKEVFIRDGWKKLSRSMEQEASGETGRRDALPAERETSLSGKRSTFFWWKLAAAVLVLVLGAGAVWWRMAAPGKGDIASLYHKNQVSTKNGSRSKIEMPDGSTVWLNGGSKLTYTEGFSQGHREVCLQGEAFFDIKKDPGHPFLIQTRQVIIKVLGTSFNVRAYRNEGQTTTTLIQGKVDIQFKDDPEKHIFLGANEKLTVIDNMGHRNLHAKRQLKYKITDIVPDTVSGIPPEDIAWVSNKLVFKNETFREVAFKMERWYDVKFIFKSKSLENEMLTGAFGKEKLEEALSALRLTTPFGYTIRLDTVYLTR